MTPADLSRALEPHLGALHRLSRRLTSSRMAAEALAQEALLAAFQEGRRLRHGKRARPFLLSLALRIHKARQEQPRPRLVVDPDELALAMRELPQEQSLALWLHEVENLGDVELGEVLDLPATAAVDRVTQARANLARQIPRGSSAPLGARLAGEPEQVGLALRAHPLASEWPPPSLSGALRGLAAGAELAWPRSMLLRTLLLPLLAAVVAAMAVGYARIPGTGPTIPDFVADEVAAQHVRALGRGAFCQKESSDPEELASWLSSTLGRTVVVPSPRDAELVCARQGWLFGQPMPAVVYRKAGALVTLFLPGPGSAAAAASARAQGHCAPGTSGQTVCVLKGPDGPRLLAGELSASALAATIRGDR